MSRRRYCCIRSPRIGADVVCLVLLEDACRRERIPFAAEDVDANVEQRCSESTASGREPREGAPAIDFSTRGTKRSRRNGKNVSSRGSASGEDASMESSPAISTAGFSTMASPASAARHAARTCWLSRARAEGSAPRARPSGRRGRTSDVAVVAEAGRLAKSLGYPRVANLIEIVPGLADSAIERFAERELDNGAGARGMQLSSQLTERVGAPSGTRSARGSKGLRGRAAQQNRRSQSRALRLMWGRASPVQSG